MSEEQLDLPLGDPDPIDEAPPPEEQAVPLTRIEQIAAVHGWKPDGKDDAVAFLERIPNYREGLTSKLRAHEQEIDKLYEALALKAKSDHAREQALRERELREAVRVGDEDAAARISKEMQQPAPVVARAPAAQEVPQIVQEWADRNAWIMQDQTKANQAMALYETELKARGGNDDPAVILPRVEAMMRKLHSNDAPPNPNRQMPTPATSGQARPSAIRKSSFDNLTPMEKRAVDQYREMGLSDEKILASIRKLEGRHGR